ncbi:MAG: XisH family protein [Desulfobacterales bacterium]
MPAKDFFHNEVKQALIKDHWTVTHDPYWLKLADSDINVYIDLAAERMIAAEKSGEKIAVEIKSFAGSSWMNDFHEAIGQFLNYRMALREKEPDRILFLAIPVDIYKSFFSRRFIQTVCQEYQIRLIVFDPKAEEIFLWKK